jgi:geranylgeranyl pyrophosphate synthase
MAAGGKRIRPVLTMIAAGAAGGNPDEAVDCGTAIEILHNFTLVHDDIMDKSPMRRGKPTVHVKWNEPLAIITGDVMVGWAYRLLPPAGRHERSKEIMEAFTRGLIEVCEGQAYDMEFNEKTELKLEDYLLMIHKKTAMLLETCAVIGGHIGHGSEMEIEALRRYAYNLGIAFQIQDDLLDLTADQAELGKTIGLDIVEGKKTYLVIKALGKEKNPEDRLLMDKFMNNNGLSLDHAPQMREMFARLGVLEEASLEAGKYFERAKDALNELKHNESVEMLGYLIDSLNNRNY